MRKAARWLLLLFAFTIPWEYSLDLGAPWGNIARITGLLLLLVAALVLLQDGAFRKPIALQCLAILLYLWFCCSYLWSISPATTSAKLPGYFQEVMLIALVWELIETSVDLRNLLRAWLAGSWVLVVLTIADFAIHTSGSPEQIRFFAPGQDPNDTARFLDFGLPIAALLLDRHEPWPQRLISAGYIPFGFTCVLLTASRSGFLIALVALAGSGILLFLRNRRFLVTGAVILPALVLVIWLLAPHETLLRLGTIVEQLRNADLNQRVNIWSAGWRAFARAPVCGHGAGTFTIAAGLAPEDTAHNTVLSALVEGGLIALALAGTIAVQSMWVVVSLKGVIRVAFFAIVAAWLLSSLVGTVGESRSTWLLLGVVAVAGRLSEESPETLESAFPNAPELLREAPRG